MPHIYYFQHLTRPQHYKFLYLEILDYTIDDSEVGSYDEKSIGYTENLDVYKIIKVM